MKRLISFAVTVFVLLFLLGVFSVSAVPSPFFLGDVTLDRDRNIKDATAVQKYVARLIEFGLLQECIADVDEDEEITVKDATHIQKAVAKIEIISGSVYPYVSYYGFYADFDSGKAMVGVPVTFTANARSNDERANPLYYEFYINGELVDNGNKESFTHIFEDSGEYEVYIKCKNSFGYEKESGDCFYKVVEPYESEAPVIKAFYVNQSSYNDYEFHPSDQNITFTAEVIFGSGEYEYAFLLDGEVIKDYSEENFYTFKRMPDEREEDYVLTVRVKDRITGEDLVSGNYMFKTIS